MGPDTIKTDCAVALDAMGGDYSPGAAIEGACLAAASFPGKILLVGREDSIRSHGPLPANVLVVHAEDIVSMHESPGVALRKKPASSLAQAVQLVHQGKAQAVISAGNTGAFMAFAVRILGRVKGISRPAIATLMPTREDPCILIDVGANVDCRPEFLLDFGIMGKVYMEKVLGRPNPRVGLLNIGHEVSKGNDLTAAALPLLEKAPINFIGNVEGLDISMGKVDVVVCDGFVGNVILKYGEGLATMVLSFLKEEYMKLKEVAGLGSEGDCIFKRMLQITDYSEYGGAPLLGVDGNCIVCHGKSTPKAIANAIRVAGRAIQYEIPQRISKEVSAVH